MAGGAHKTEVIDLSISDEEDSTNNATRHVAPTQPPKRHSTVADAANKRQRGPGLVERVDLTSPEPNKTRSTTTGPRPAKTNKPDSAPNSRASLESRPKSRFYSQGSHSHANPSHDRPRSHKIVGEKGRATLVIDDDVPSKIDNGDDKPFMSERQSTQPPDRSVPKTKRPREDDRPSHSLSPSKKKQRLDPRPLLGSSSAHGGTRPADPPGAKKRATSSLNDAVSSSKKSLSQAQSSQKISNSFIDLTGVGPVEQLPQSRRQSTATSIRPSTERARPSPGRSRSPDDIRPPQNLQASTLQEERRKRSPLEQFLGGSLKDARRTTATRASSSVQSPKRRSRSPSNRAESRPVLGSVVRSSSVGRGSEIPESLPGSPVRSERLLESDLPRQRTPEPDTSRKWRSVTNSSSSKTSGLRKSAERASQQDHEKDISKDSPARQPATSQRRRAEASTESEQKQQSTLKTTERSGGLTSPRSANGTASPVTRPRSPLEGRPFANSPLKKAKLPYPPSPSETTSEENGNVRERTPKKPDKENAVPKTSVTPKATLQSLHRSPQHGKAHIGTAPVSNASTEASPERFPNVKGPESTIRHSKSTMPPQVQVNHGDVQDIIPSGKTHRETGHSVARAAEKHVTDVPIATQREPLLAPNISAADYGRIPGFPNQSLSNRVEQVVGHYIGEMQRDNEHWARTKLRRARLAAANRPPLDEEPPTDVFSKMKPLPLTNLTKIPSSRRLEGSYAKFGAELGKVQTKWAAPLMPIRTSAKDVPSYSHYVSIKNNFLARNDPTLQHWPYFGDEVNPQIEEALGAQYSLDITGREKKLLDLARAETSATYAEDMLEELGCAWSDVLYFLLHQSPLPNVGKSSPAGQALERRKEFCEDAFRTSARWVTLLSGLPEPKQESIEKAALICDHFQKLLKLSLWHVVRRSTYTNDLLRKQQERPDLRELTCRVCMRFDCPYHGEVKDTDDSRSDSDDASTNGVETDIVHPPDVNHRSRVIFPPSLETQHGPASAKDRRSVAYWQTGANALLKFKPDERGPFYPCHHPGTSCSTAKCSCYENQIPCEKTCACSPSCSRKFQGCNCASDKTKSGQRLVCFESSTCACFQYGRECDPDLCGECGVCDVVDPVHKHDDRVLIGRCRNANMQRGVQKHTVLGDSGVHGLGLYACESIQHHEFVGEYKGEVIQKDEADRRGAVYEYQKLSYLFSLNNTQEIDSTYFGTKTRFINHASEDRANLYPRIIMVNAVHRIALYGGRAIASGEELFFNYGPQFPEDQLGGKKSKKQKREQYEKQSKAAPHVRNAGLVRNFDDVEEGEDEHGNVRARAASKTKRPVGRPPAILKLKNPGPRGGARPGAGRPRKVLPPDEDEEEAPKNDLHGYSQDFMFHNIKDDDPEEPRAAEPDDEDFEMGSEESMDDEEPEESSEEDDEDIVKPPRGRGRPRKERL